MLYLEPTNRGGEVTVCTSVSAGGMASAWSEEETFICSVCLDTLKDPATLPCGHSYCLACIQGHWDRGGSKGQYSCPQCRQVFNPRPSLARSTVLMEAMEKLRAGSFKQTSISSAPPSMPVYLDVLPDTGAMAPQRQGSVYPQLPTVARGCCHQHQRPLDLFCHDDKESVCEECCQHGHKGHRVLKTQEERAQRQTELVQMQADVQRRIKETEKEINELPQTARQHKASVQALQKESVDLFSELVKSVELMGTQVGELLSNHETSLGSRAEGQIQRLEQEVAQLHRRSEELKWLADMQDHICFLKNFQMLEPLGQSGTREEAGLCQEEAVVASIRSAMKELSDSLQDVCKASLAKIFRVVNDVSMAPAANGVAAAADSSQANAQNTVYEMTTNLPPSAPPRPHASATPPPLPPPRVQAPPMTTLGLVSPEPKTREDLLKFRCEPTMDPNSAYRHVLLSEGGHKATLRAENVNPTDHPERFHFWRQVLCREPLAGSPYYWEVEWTGQKMTVGVAYKEMERKGSNDQSRLGHNAMSWSLYWSGTGFSFWHGGQETLLGSPMARHIGVYLDQHAGVLAFYRITNNQAYLIHRYQTQFTGPLYPGFRFWTGVGTTVTVCQLD
ncbi:finTRIM family, member 86 isoform X2 [Myripristis murdjan]|uniref:Tripartite motif-containing protein 16-like n=1 Tax=Myripristis murdjan TaxID=586833 RepID=A0A667Y922_9TELE|nr:tripartite motif-containing protein 16-like isoform X2 [Myripristis murdjan]